MAANETLKGLNSHLFEQLDRLSKAGKEDLQSEISRTDAMVKIGGTVIDTYTTQLRAIELVATHKGLGEGQQTPTIPLAKLEI